MGRTRKEVKYLNEVRTIIIDSRHNGISSTDIAKQLKIESYQIKYALQSLSRNNEIITKRTFGHKQNKEPDGRRMKFFAINYKDKLPINANQLAIINGIRISKQLNEVRN